MKNQQSNKKEDKRIYRTFEEYEEKFNLVEEKCDFLSVDDPYAIGACLAEESLKQFERVLAVRK